MATAALTRGIRAALSAGAALICGLALPSAAVATFPGRNGKIAFYTLDRGGVRTLKTMNPDGSSVRPLRRPGNIGRWSANGRRLVGDRPDGRGIFVVNASGTGYQAVRAPGFRSAYAPSWAPDGRRIVFVGVRAGEFGLWTMRLDGSGIRKVIEARRIPPPSDCSHSPATQEDITAPEWSPDGSRIVFGVSFPVYPQGCDTSPPRSSQIHVVDADGSDRRNLSPAVAADTEPSWSPDGRRILFWLRNFEVRFENAAGIWTMNADGSRRRRLVRDGYQQSWSPDGRWILFMGTRARSPGPFVVSAAGGTRRRIAARYWGPAIWGPAWQPLPR